MIPVYIEHNGIRVGQVIKLINDKVGLKVVFILYDHYDFNYLSIGFKCLQWTIKQKIRYIYLAKIMEISLVKNPAQLGTKYYKI